MAAVCGISIDITEIKKARDQVKRLSDSIIHPKLPVLVLTMHEEEQCVVRAIEAGAP